jgi:hypothetical protein
MTLLSFIASATDPDSGQTLTFSLDEGAPGGAVINSDSGRFTWTPTEAQGPGTYSITARVTDNGEPNLSHARTFQVTVFEVNRAPVLSPIGNKTVDEQTLLSFTALASDPDIPANTLTFSLDEGAPPGAGIQPGSGLFTWTPTETQGPGVYSITIVVTDSGTPPLNAAETISVTVREVNRAPVLTPIPDQQVTLGSTVTLTAVGSDPDIPLNTLTYSLDPGAPSGSSIHPSTGLFSWAPQASQSPSTNAVTVRVTDNGIPQLSAARTFQIIVHTTALLEITAIEITSSDTIAITWSSEPGATYHLESRDRLDEPTWVSLGAYTATGTITTAHHTPSGSAQCYYRVLRVE